MSSAQVNPGAHEVRALRFDPICACGMWATVDGRCESCDARRMDRLDDARRELDYEEEER